MHRALPLSPIRHQNNFPPRTPPLGKPGKNTDEMDELAGDTIPCSPFAFFKEQDPTQPTQVLGRPAALHLDAPSSPPSSIVEVPASSPFQPQKKQSTRIGSRLAPAGTVFRPPPRPQQPIMVKRPSPEPIIVLSDDDDDDEEENLMPPRGDIRPTTFKSQIAAFAYRPPLDDTELNKKLRQVFDVLGDRFPPEKVRGALRANKYDVRDTISMLERQKTKIFIAPTTTTTKKSTGRRLMSKEKLLATLKPKAKPVPEPEPEPRREPEKAPSPPPQQPRRRLVQGLRKRRATSPEVVDLEETSAQSNESHDPLVIDLVDNDKEDAYQAESSPEPTAEDDDKVLSCINNSTLKELAAITGLKENLLEPLIEKRPFDTLGQARKVSAGKKPGARKSARICIGETAVDAVEVFLNAVEAIDKVVAKCEMKGKAVSSVVESWDLNVFGQSKRASPDGDLPPTPTSFTTGSTKYVRPIVPRQPLLMDGHCVMKPFQLFGLNWMSVLYNYDIGCILADEMGLGKTCQVISFICHLVEEDERNPKKRRPWPNLIVVPPSTYNNWLVEFKRFAPGLSVVGYRGSQSERAETAYMVEQDPEAYHVVLATYSQINCEEDIDAMRSFDLNAAIFDEGHKMKNPQTKIYRDLKRIPAAWKMLLTGTPVQNNLLEMTSLLNFINPRLFDGCMNHIQYIFSQKVTIRDVTNGAFLYSERVKRARTILEPFILQRRKDQVLSDMPRKICTVVHCEMSESQRETYNEYEELFKLEPSKRAGRAKGRQNDMNNVWMQLRKAALHPLLFRRHFSDNKVEEMAKMLMDRIPQSELHQPDIKHLTQELKNSSDFELHLWCRDYSRLLRQFDIPPAAELDSGKVKMLLTLIKQYQKNGDRVLVFSKFSRLIELLSEVMALQGIDYRVLMGNTEVSERQKLIDDFNNNPDIPVFLLTTGAGGTGINLTSANKVIIFDQSDNPQDDIQAENRAHRLGQKRDVEVIRFIAAQTIEELIYKACQKKIELANKVTGAIGEAEAEAHQDDKEAAQNLEKEVRRMMMMEEQMTPP